MRDTAAGAEQVLLTGASGFVAKQILLDLLDAGYRVRGTVRNRDKGGRLKALVARLRPETAGRFETVEADLTRDAGWDRAAEGCAFVLHTASPFPLKSFSDRQALVPVARGGTERVMRAAAAAGVRRVVVTSSVAAIGYGHGGRTRFGEEDWTNVDSPSVSAYAVSKTEAERAAWREARAGGLELVSINPAVVLGPVQDCDFGTSARIVQMMMRGRAPAVPRVGFGIVDVRDVAAAHVKALSVPEAAGRRFLLSSDSLFLREIGRIVGEAVPEVSGRTPRFTLPDWAVRAAAPLFNEARMLAGELGAAKTYDCAPAAEILGLALRPPREAVAATARSLRDLSAASKG